KNSCGELVLESGAVDIIDVAAHRPLVVGKGWGFPDHGDLRRIDFARLAVELQYRVIEDAHFEGARLHELDGPAVVARETDAGEDFIGAVAAELLADIELRHQSA